MEMQPHRRCVSKLVFVVLVGTLLLSTIPALAGGGETTREEFVITPVDALPSGEAERKQQATAVSDEPPISPGRALLLRSTSSTKSTDGSEAQHNSVEEHLVDEPAIVPVIVKRRSPVSPSHVTRSTKNPGGSGSKSPVRSKSPPRSRKGSVTQSLGDGGSGTQSKQEAVVLSEPEIVLDHASSPSEHGGSGTQSKQEAIVVSEPEIVPDHASSPSEPEVAKELGTASKGNSDAVLATLERIIAGRGGERNLDEKQKRPVAEQIAYLKELAEQIAYLKALAELYPPIEVPGQAEFAEFVDTVDVDTIQHKLNRQNTRLRGRTMPPRGRPDKEAFADVYDEILKVAMLVEARRDAYTSKKLAEDQTPASTDVNEVLQASLAMMHRARSAIYEVERVRNILWSCNQRLAKEQNPQRRKAAGATGSVASSVAKLDGLLKNVRGKREKQEEELSKIMLDGPKQKLKRSRKISDQADVILRKAMLFHTQIPPEVQTSCYRHRTKALTQMLVGH